MDSIENLKELQRKAGIDARKALGEKAAADYSEAIADRIMAHPAFAGSRLILSYQPFAGEVDVGVFGRLAERAGKTLAYPICRGRGVMVAALPEDSGAWEIGRYGIRAPVEARSRLADPQELDIVIVPCAAFDGETRMRIGWGAGYYDRYLPLCARAVRIAVAFEAQKVTGLAADPRWDVPMDAVVTESATY
ncbi:MAG: 5-formyltetrahydrofolate cyclo-ligase [Clostridiales Family XIII bacterium]|jgi:5-formyltetrahydrofolate cyclo-ligase|nr:5-formyltetrahydrofolate cyclo-ligase [Clostridiales Family XIII bacterium]